MSSFYVENFGCRATQADGAAIEHQFLASGLDRAPGWANAGYVVLNTCAVTASAEQDARAAIRRIRRQNPGCKIVITGCYAQRVPGEVASLPGVFAVVGNSHKPNLAQITLRKDPQDEGNEPGPFVPLRILQDTGRPEIFVSDIFAHTQLLAAPVFDSANERTRPNLKVQDGCNNRCSFCIIPSVRGRSRSLELEGVVREVNQLVEAGYREVVIAGINLGRWGRDLALVGPGALTRAGELRSPAAGRVRAPAPTRDIVTFEDLVQAILRETSLEKLRISSVEPMDWSDWLIRLMAESPRIAKHAHVPMQSGSDSVLRRMHRKYRPWHYREKIEKIRSAMPTAAIGADVMVGFPGETEAEFEETRRMVDDLPFTYLHVFTFSARPGTPAATMPNQVPVRVARERSGLLRELAAEKKHAFMRAFIGKPLESITLSRTTEGLDTAWTDALTDNFLKAKIAGKHASNQWLTANVEKIENGELLASVETICFPSTAATV